MKNNSELKEFIEQLGAALKHQACYNRVRSFSEQREDNICIDQRHLEKAARILHELATNPKYEDMNAREALDDLIGGV